MKKTFTAPEAEVVQFEVEDVITVSGEPEGPTSCLDDV